MARAVYAWRSAAMASCPPIRSSTRLSMYRWYSTISAVSGRPAMTATVAFGSMTTGAGGGGGGAGGFTSGGLAFGASFVGDVASGNHWRTSANDVSVSHALCWIPIQTLRPKSAARARPTETLSDVGRWYAFSETRLTRIDGIAHTMATTQKRRSRTSGSGFKPATMAVASAP